MELLNRLWLAIFYAFLVIVLNSCSASWHQRKACSKDPKLCEPVTVQLDTVITIPGETVGLFLPAKFPCLEVSDTTLKIGRTEMIVRKEPRGVSFECRTDTVVKTITKTVTVEPGTRIEKVVPWWLWAILALCGILILVLLFRS